MKKTVQLILLGLVAQSGLQAQTAIDASGGFAKNSNYSASYAIGEIQSITLKSGVPTKYATSGVIQPDPVTLTSINDPLRRSFKLYPNPVTDVLKIDHNENASILYKIYDFYGKVLGEGPLMRPELKLGPLPPGVYMIEFYGKSLSSHQVYLISKI